jgi:hypothetical protein
MQLYTSWKVVFVASFKCVTIGYFVTTPKHERQEKNCTGLRQLFTYFSLTFTKLSHIFSFY